jgi:hypothetical protein
VSTCLKCFIPDVVSRLETRHAERLESAKFFVPDTHRTSNLETNESFLHANLAVMIDCVEDEAALDLNAVGMVSREFEAEKKQLCAWLRYLGTYWSLDPSLALPTGLRVRLRLDACRLALGYVVPELGLTDSKTARILPKTLEYLLL